MLAPADLAGIATLAEPRLDRTGRQLAWVVADAAGVRVRVTTIDDAPRDLAGPAPRLRGGSLDWVGDGLLVVAGADGGLWRVPLDGGSGLQVADDERVEAVAVSPDGGHVAYVADQRAIRVVDLDGGSPITVSDESDFALDPVWSPDGRSLAWHAWDVPHMPWDRSRVVVAPVQAGAKPVTVAGGRRLRRAVAQPRWLADGRLAWLDDRDGFLVPYVAGADGTEERSVLHDVHLDHAPPTWGAGLRSWDVSPDASFLVADRNEDGFGRLVAHRLDNGEGASVGRGVHAGVCWRGHRVAAVRSGARTPPEIVVYDMAALAEKIDELAAIATQQQAVVDTADSMERSPEWVRERVREATLRTGQVPLARPPHRTVVERSTDLDVAELPEPEVVRFSAGGRTATARFYAPAASPPHRTVLWTHGGPHDQMRVEWKHRVAFFVARGWAVLTVDHRGTTGHGRDWTQSLREEWGVADVADTVDAVDAVVERGMVDPDRVVAAGSSAGGFTTLNLLAHHPAMFAGGIALYPVADLAGLRQTTHRFEAHYNDSLVGGWPEHSERYRQRSPSTVAGRIAGPLLVLHGADDEVVPVGQATDLVAAVADAGGEVDLHVYPGEGHGWHRPGVAEDELQRMAAFLHRIEGARP